MCTVKAKIGRRFVITCALILCSVGELSAQFGGFGGMSGFGNPGGQGQSMPGGASLRPWLAANGSYSENLTGKENFSQVPTSVGYGASGGLNGGKAWRRDSLVGSATASYQRFGHRSVASGVAFASSLGYSHQFSQRVGFFANQTFSTTFGGYGYGAGMSSFGSFGLSGIGVFRDFGFGTGFGFSDPANNGVVDSDIIGSRVYFLASSVGLTYQPTLRWQFNVGSTVTAARRQNASLNDVTSYGGGGSAGYRVSERLTVGVSGQYSTFSYGGRFSDNKSLYGGFGFTYQATPRTMISAMAGMSAYRSTSFATVAFDPILADLIGQPTILNLQKISVASGAGSANITHTRGPFSFAANYDRGITPGNGILYASRRDSVYGSASYRPINRVGTNLYASYGRLNSLQQSGARNESTSVGGNVDVRITNSLFFILGGGYRYSKLSTLHNLSQRFATVGLSWSPEGAMFRF